MKIMVELEKYPNLLVLYMNPHGKFLSKAHFTFCLRSSGDKLPGWPVSRAQREAERVARRAALCTSAVADESSVSVGAADSSASGGLQ